MKATKKLIGASVALAVAAALTVGTTFAWFSYQSDVELAEIGFSVDSGDENLQVAVTNVGGSVSNGDFVFSLPESIIKNKINNNNAVSYAQLTLDDGTVAANNMIELKHKNNGTAATSSEYVAFDLVFRYTPGKGVTTAPSLILDFGSAVTADTDDTSYNPQKKIYAWKELTESEYGITNPVSAGNLIKARARDAARVAFVFGDSTDVTNKVWAPSEEIPAGTVTSDSAKGFYKGNLASDFFIHTNNLGDDAKVTAPTYANRVYAGIATPAKAEDFAHSTITQLSLTSDVTITVKVWLEGRDGDCIDSVLGDSFKFLLKFRTSTI